MAWLWFSPLLVLVAQSLGAEPASTPSKAGINVDLRKQQHPWLWQAPQPQTVPSVDGFLARSEVDRFLLARMAAKGLKPAGPADDATWLRRVHFAITGLPPTREELQAFLRRAPDEPGSREQVVDQLLASPHYGERWARHWMDLMRYAESRGHESDFIIANAWHYRDYLIRAFNADVPYRQFVMEHVAGDLLPQPRLRADSEANESVLATGWAFLGEENHSPVDIRQDECERIDNKVDVFSKTFLGLTVSCARCHDHKFDPIRTEDYYALTGFMLSSSFRQVRFEAMENNRRVGDQLRRLRAEYTPRLARASARAFGPSASHTAEYLLAAAAEIGGKVKPTGIDLLDDALRERWVGSLRQALTNSTHPLHLFARQAGGDRAAGTPGVPTGALGASRLGYGGARVLLDFSSSTQALWKVDGEAFGNRPTRPGDLVLGTEDAQPIARVMSYAAASRDLFWNRIKLTPGNENDSGRLGATGRAGQMFRTPTFTLEVGKLHYLVRGRGRVYAAVDSHLMNEGPLHAQLVRTFDTGASTSPEWVTHDLTLYQGHRTHLEFGPEGAGWLDILAVVEAPQPPSAPAGFRFQPSPAGSSLADFAQQIQQEILASVRWLESAGDATAPAGEATLRTADWVVGHPELFVGPGVSELDQVAREFGRARTELASQVLWESRTAVSWFDGTGVDEHVLVRGKPFKPGVLSPRALPVALTTARPIRAETTSGRYELAEQLIDPTNPLVARTLVNRVWHHLFGRGIVASVDNFGALGEPPTHPELLDHLAWQFIHQDQWSMKRLIRRLVLTDAFGRSSRPSDARAEELDPGNTLLHRMSVRRLEGEVIRDALLTVSGRLDPTVGGPPVPVHLTEFLVGRGRPEHSGPLDGGGRRSVYIALRRNFIPTFMQTFDLPTPFSTVGRRNVTNVPAQSLALMNDPLFHQQSRVWAERLLREFPRAQAPVRVQWLYESGYGRLPTPAELAACLDSLVELRGLRSTASDDDPEVWTDLCHALLNASEFIYLK